MDIKVKFDAKTVVAILALTVSLASFGYTALRGFKTDQRLAAIGDPYLLIVEDRDPVDPNTAYLKIKNAGVNAAQITGGHFNAASLSDSAVEHTTHVGNQFPAVGYRFLPMRDETILSITVEDGSPISAMNILQQIEFALCYTGPTKERSWIIATPEEAYSLFLESDDTDNSCPWEEFETG